MSHFAVAYCFLCLGFCLGFAVSTVLMMHRRAARENRYDGHTPPERNPPPRTP